jgi:hypothetical protein
MSSIVTSASEENARGAYPAELVALRERIREQAPDVRAELEPLIEEVFEHAEFRGRVLGIARDALERFRLDLTSLKFDLAVTRRERDSLRLSDLDAD